MKELSDLLDVFPYCLLIMFPMMIALSPIVPVDCSVDFQAHRLAHYEIGNSGVLGSKSASVALEARTSGSPGGLLRKMAVESLRNLTVSGFNEIISAGAAGLLILIPKFSGEELEDIGLNHKDHSILQLEEHLLTTEIEIPVYFVEENEDTGYLLDDLRSTTTVSGGTSGSKALFNTVFGTGYQFVSSAGYPKALSDPVIASFHGKLSGKGDEDSLPTILLVAHYDSSGAAPGMSKGANSNGSGVTILLELARLWSKLYSSPHTRPGFNMVFLISGGGKVNYFGTKRWIEEYKDNDLNSEILSNVAFTICLDSLGNGDSDIFFHVSKPPKEDTPSGLFFRSLSKISKILYPESSVKLIHKKINLADELLAWEHERFSIRRIPAFTLSSISAHDSYLRNSILDREISQSSLVKNTRLIAEALACNVYSECSGRMFEGSGLAPDSGSMSGWSSYLSSIPRATSLLVNPSKSTLHPLVQALADNLKYRSHEFKILNSKRDKREAEFGFYDSPVSKISAYKVKPSVFDLFLTMGICAYLGLVYVFLSNFESLTAVWRAATVKKPVYTNGHAIKSNKVF